MKIGKSIKTYFITALLFLGLAVLLFSGAAAARGGDAKKVLLLHSYHSGYKWTDQQQEGVLSALDSFRGDYDLRVEYMDTKKVYKDNYLKALPRIYEAKYRDVDFDLIISTDDNAYNFLQENRESLFPNVPVVLCGVNWMNAAEVEAAPGFTGVSEKADIEENFQGILKVLPDTERIIVIADRTTTGNKVRAQLRDIKKRFSGREIVILDDKPLNELEKDLAGLPEDSVVLLTVFFQDRAGNFYEYDEQARAISQASPVPVFGQWSFSLGEGVIGGYLTDAYLSGVKAGQLALRILEGEAVDGVKPVSEVQAEYIFDETVMERFDIDRQQLPQGSRIINRSQEVGELEVQLKAKSVASQIAEYLSAHPELTMRDLQQDEEFGNLAVQLVGDTGYTSVMDSLSGTVYFHPRKELVNTSSRVFSESLPSLWRIFSRTIGKQCRESSGYYNWKEDDGHLSEKYMYLACVEQADAGGRRFFVAATSYLDELEGEKYLQDLQLEVDASKWDKRAVARKAEEVARQIEIYISDNQELTVEDLQDNTYFRQIAIQKFGQAGYTAVADCDSLVSRFHPDRELEDKDLVDIVGDSISFRRIITQSRGGSAAAGEYAWPEPDGRPERKFMHITPVSVTTAEGACLNVAATVPVAELDKDLSGNSQTEKDASIDPGEFLGNIADTFDRRFEEQVRYIRSWAKNPLVLQLADKAGEYDLEEVFKSWGASSSLYAAGERIGAGESVADDIMPEATRYLRDLQSTYKYYPEIFVVDKRGYVLAATGKTGDFDQGSKDWAGYKTEKGGIKFKSNGQEGAEEWFTSALRDGLYIGPYAWDESVGRRTVDVAVRIDGRDGPGGALKAVFDIGAFVQEYVSDYDFSGLALVGPNNNLIARSGEFRTDLFSRIASIIADGYDQGQEAGNLSVSGVDFYWQSFQGLPGYKLILSSPQTASKGVASLFDNSNSLLTALGLVVAVLLLLLLLLFIIRYKLVSLESRKILLIFFIFTAAIISIFIYLTSVTIDSAKEARLEQAYEDMRFRESELAWNIQEEIKFLRNGITYTAHRIAESYAQPGLSRELQEFARETQGIVKTAFVVKPDGAVDELYTEASDYFINEKIVSGLISPQVRGTEVKLNNRTQAAGGSDMFLHKSVYEQDEYLGEMVFILDVRRLSSFVLTGERTGGGKEFYILDNSGAVLLANIEDAVGSNISRRKARLDPENDLTAERRLELLGREYTLFGVLDKQAVLQGLNENTSMFWTVVILLIFSLIVMGAAFLGVLTSSLRREVNKKAKEVQQKLKDEEKTTEAMTYLLEKADRTEEVLKAREKEFRSYVEGSPEGLFITSKTGDYTFVNQAAADLLGYSRKELMEMNITDITPSEAMESIRSSFQELTRKGEINKEMELVKKDKTRVFVILRAVKLAEDRYLAFCTDITQIKKMQNKLKEGEKKYRQIFELIPQAVIKLDTKGNILDINGRVWDILGYTVEETVGKNIFKLPFISDESKKKMIENYKRRVSGEEVEPYEIKYIAKNGKEVIGLISGTTIYSADGKPEGDLIISTNITERKRAEEKIKVFSDAIADAYDSIMLLDMEGVITYANESTLRAFSRKGDDLEGRLVSELIYDPDKEDEIRAQMGKTGKWTGEITGIRKNKETFPVLASFSLITDEENNRAGIILVCRDISKSKEMETKLKESEKRLNTMFDGATIGILVADRSTGRIRFSNKAIRKFLGYGEKELYKMNIKDIHPQDDWPRVKKQFEKQAAGKLKLIQDIPCARQDGQVVYADISADPLDLDGKPSMVGFFQDVTEIRKNRKEIQNLRRLDKMKDEFLNIAAHELKTPLTSILGMSEIVLGQAGALPKPQQRSLGLIHEEATRLKRVVKQILTVTRFESGNASVNIEEFKVCELIESVRPTLEIIAKDNKAKMDIQADCKSAKLKSDKEKVIEVLYNLVGNAAKYGREGQVITVRVYKPDKSHIRVSVSDQGKGISEVMQKNLFVKFGQLEPSLSRSQEGTGLGLYICRLTVEQLGGEIGVESTKGKGSTFYFTLPLKADSNKKKNKNKD